MPELVGDKKAGRVEGEGVRGRKCEGARERKGDWILV